MKIANIVITLCVGDEDDYARVHQAINTLQALVSESSHDTKKVPITAHEDAFTVSASHTHDRDAVLAASVRTLPIKTRAHHALMLAGVTTIAHLVRLTPNQLREVHGIGRAAAHAIERALDELHVR